MMSLKYKFWNTDALYFVTFAVVDWVDVFTRNEYRRIVIDSINYCIANKGLVVHAWVIMSNHVHFIMSLDRETRNTLSDIVRDVKKYTAMHLIKFIKENPQESRKDWMIKLFAKAGKYNSNNVQFQLRQQDNHPIEIQNEEQLYNTIAYIHNNPVKAGWVVEPDQFPWSSAVDYCGGKGLVNIELLKMSFVK